MLRPLYFERSLEYDATRDRLTFRHRRLVDHWITSWVFHAIPAYNRSVDMCW